MPWASAPSQGGVVAVQQGREGASPALLPPSLKDAPVMRSLAGCMESERKGCMCWDYDRQPLDIPDAQCRALLLRPLPRVLGISS